MKEDSGKDILFSLHIGESGGSSFRHYLKSMFPFSFFSHYLYNWPETISKVEKRRKIPILNRNMVVHGHMGANYREKSRIPLHYPYANQFITLIRNPLDRSISKYYYNKKLYQECLENGTEPNDLQLYIQTAELDELLVNERNIIPNHVLYEITPDNFKKKLHGKFVHILSLEDLEQSLKILKKDYIVFR